MDKLVIHIELDAESQALLEHLKRFEAGSATARVVQLEKELNELKLHLEMYKDQWKRHYEGEVTKLREQTALEQSQWFAEHLNHEVEDVQARVTQLETAIRAHRDQRGDDRCWLDDADLYKVLGPAVVNTALPPAEEFAANCQRFHASRQNPNHTYVTVAQQLTAERQVILKHVLNLRVQQRHAEAMRVTDLIASFITTRIEDGFK